MADLIHNPFRNKDTIVGKNVDRGVYVVYFAEFGKAINPLDDAGVFCLGTSTKAPDFAYNPEFNTISAGYAMTTIVDLPKKDDREIELEFVMPSITLMDMARLSNDIPTKYNYSTTGQDTVKATPAPTIRSLTLDTAAAGLEFKINDMVLIETKHSTLGGWDSPVIITNVVGDTIYFDRAIAVPKVGGFVKKLAGYTTGTTQANTGLQSADLAVAEFKNVQLLFVSDYPASRSVDIKHVPQFNINSGSVKYSGEYVTVTLKGKFIMQDPESFVDQNGLNVSMPFFAKNYRVPAEST